MSLGTGWLIIEESIHTGTKSLVSIISPRKQERYVKEFMEQLYVDKYASFDEKIAYKKNNKFVRAILENIARHRTADLRAEMQGKDRNTLGYIYRSILEPICYAVGKYKMFKDK